MAVKFDPILGKLREDDSGGSYDATYLKLDASNDPLTGSLTIGSMTPSHLTYGSDLCSGGTSNASHQNAPSEGHAQAFDNNFTSTKWLCFNTTPWISYQFGSGAQKTIQKYTITSGNDDGTRDPKNWQFQGSNDGSTWTTVDTRTGETFATRLLKKEFTFSNSTAYNYYRLNITANNGSASITQLEEIEMMEANPLTDTSLFVLGDVEIDGITHHDGATYNNAATVFNEAGADIDQRMEGDNDPNLFFLDASTDRINMGGSTPGAKLQVDTFSASEKGLIVKGASSQTANLQEWQNSSGSLLTSIDKDGFISNSATYAISSGTINMVALAPTAIPTSGANFNFFRGGTTLSSGSAHSGIITTMRFEITKAGSGTSSDVRFVDAVYFISGGGETTNLYLFKGDAQKNGTGKIGTAYGLYLDIRNTNATNNIDNLYYIRCRTPGATGTITNEYGLYLDSINTGTNSYAITTNAGNIVFNEGGDASTDVRIEGDTDANLLFTDASADKVGIGMNNPSEKLDVTGNIKASGTITGSNLSGTNTGDVTKAAGSDITTGTNDTLFATAKALKDANVLNHTFAIPTVIVNGNGEQTTSTSYNDMSYWKTSFNKGQYTNYVSIVFQVLLQQDAVGSYQVWCQLVDGSGTVVTGSEVTATLTQYATSVQISGDISANLAAGAESYRVQAKTAAGGTVNIQGASIVVNVKA